jgi:hypothetical protein
MHLPLIAIVLLALAAYWGIGFALHHMSAKVGAGMGPFLRAEQVAIWPYAFLAHATLAAKVITMDFYAIWKQDIMLIRGLSLAEKQMVSQFINNYRQQMSQGAQVPPGMPH